MFGLLRTRLALAAVFGLSLSPLSAMGADSDFKPDFKRVPITTFDGVKLEGTFYPNPGGKKDACVLLLHNFDRLKGGDSHSDGWDHLAAKLQEKGYVVLSFDFRGFGQSKTLDNPAKFWGMRHNMALKGAGKQAETIDQKNFPPHYYFQLINDIAAAKAFLDRQNDAGACNTSNLVVIGAGDGAALGTLWLASQCALWRDRNPNPLGLGMPIPDDPEIKDVSAVVWLSLSPTVAGHSAPLRSAFREVGRENKVPIAFLYGQKDAKGANIAKFYLEESRGTKADLKMTAEKGVPDTDLVGSKLLQEGLQTEDLIVNKYLEFVLEKRGSPARKQRNLEKSRFFWTFPRPGAPGAQTIPAKPAGEEQPVGIPLEKLGVTAGP
jgi:pimeloyl-ACP methyl ester carboxylesterase